MNFKSISKFKMALALSQVLHFYSCVSPCIVSTYRETIEFTL